MVANEAGSAICEIEVVCSDVEEHNSRYLSRVADIEGLEYGPWSDVVNREYEDWTTRDVVVDTAFRSIAESQAELLTKLEGFVSA